jgi:hypothetical protein
MKETGGIDIILALIGVLLLLSTSLIAPVTKDAYWAFWTIVEETARKDISKWNEIKMYRCWSEFVFNPCVDNFLFVLIIGFCCFLQPILPTGWCFTEIFFIPLLSMWGLASVSFRTDFGLWFSRQIPYLSTFKILSFLKSFLFPISSIGIILLLIICPKYEFEVPKFLDTYLSKPNEGIQHVVGIIIKNVYKSLHVSWAVLVTELLLGAYMYLRMFPTVEDTHLENVLEALNKEKRSDFIHAKISAGSADEVFGFFHVVERLWCARQHSHED